MAAEAAANIGAISDVNTSGNPTEIAMSYLQNEVTFTDFRSLVSVCVGGGGIFV